MSCLSGGWGVGIKESQGLRPMSSLASLPVSSRERNQILLMEAGSLQGSTPISLTW